VAAERGQAERRHWERGGPRCPRPETSCLPGAADLALCVYCLPGPLLSWLQGDFARRCAGVFVTSNRFSGICRSQPLPPIDERRLLDLARHLGLSSSRERTDWGDKGWRCV
jgi:hypothetical protein